MPTRQFNVYSEKVVVYPGEQFNWFANASAFDNGNVSVQSTDWPLSPSDPTLTSNSPSASVSVLSTAGAPSSYQFSCTPANPDVTRQTLIIARQYVDSLCSEVQVLASDHFIWHNTTSLGVTIAPSSANADNWPLSQTQYDLAPGDWVSVQIPSDAEANSYDLSITYSDGTQPCDDMATQPKIVITGGPASQGR